MKFPVLISDNIYIPKVPELSEMYEKIRDEFTYNDPAYSKLKAMGKWVGGRKQTIETWANVIHPEFDACISIPRGGMTRFRDIAQTFDLELVYQDQRFSAEPIAYLENSVTLWPEQQHLVEVMLEKENCLIRAPTASGKCLAPDIEVLMYSGDIKQAKDVVPGDYLMGPDSKPRKVLSTSTGHGPMYRVEPFRGESWECNDDHILTLVNTSTDKIVDISVDDYLTENLTFKHVHKLFSTGVEFEEKLDTSLPIDPYFLGLWIGDGRKSLQFIEISTMDKEIISFMENFASKIGLVYDVYEDKRNKLQQCRIVGYSRNPVKRGYNWLLQKLRKMMRPTLRIPHEYLTSTRHNRLELLAGLLDTDGHLNEDTYFEFAQKNKTIASNVVYLAQSLGFKVTQRPKYVNGQEYQRINILGDVYKIPTKIKRKQATKRVKATDALRTGFKIKPIGLGPYVGWTLDKDGHYLLGDFTVTHNTELSLKLAETLLKVAGPVLIIVWEGSPRSGLMKQWLDRISQRFNIPKSEIGIIGSGKKSVGPLTVAMQQTLANVGRLFIHKFGSVICDEVQRFAAPTFTKVINIFPARYRYGISASEERRDQKQFLIYDAFGEVAETVDKSVLIARNKIVEPVYRLIPTETKYELKFQDQTYSWNELPSENKDFNELLKVLCWNEERNDLIWHFLKSCLLVESNTIVIATHRVEHAKYWSQRIISNGYTCGLLLGGINYEEQFETTSESLRARKIRVGVGTIQKIAQGHDLPAINRGFILTPLAGNKQQFEQLCGRFRRTCEGKKDAIVYYMWDKNVYPQDKKRLMKNYPGYVQEFGDGEFVDL